MPTKNLFIIIIKVIGLFFLKDFLVAFPTLLSSIYFFIKSSEGFTTEGVIYVLLNVFFYLSIVFLAVFRSEAVVSFLKLGKDMDDQHITFKLHRSSILTIALIIIGGIMIINSAPDLFIKLYNYWQSKKLEKFGGPSSMIGLVVPAIRFIIGLLLIGNTRGIVNLIELKRRRATELQPDSSADHQNHLSS